MKAYSKICDIVFSIIKWIVAVMMLFMVILTFVEVVRRYAFHTNWVWSEVLVRYLIVYCTFLGGSAAYRAGSLTGFDLLTHRMSKKMQIVMNLICSIVILALAAWLTKLGIDTLMKPSIVNQIVAELHISIKWIYLAIPFGFATMVMFAVENIIKYITDLKPGKNAAKIEEVGNS